MILGPILRIRWWPRNPINLTVLFKSLFRVKGAKRKYDQCKIFSPCGEIPMKSLTLLTYQFKANAGDKFLTASFHVIDSL